MGREEGREGGKGERGAGARSPAQVARGPLLSVCLPACLPCLATARPRPRIRKGQQPPTVQAGASDVSSSFTFLKRRSCADKASSNACAPTERAREEDEEQEGRLELQHAEPERKP